MAEEEYQVALRLLREVFNLGGHAEALEGKIKSLSCELAEAREKLAKAHTALTHCLYAVIEPNGPLYGVDSKLIDEIEATLSILPAPAAEGEKPGAKA